MRRPGADSILLVIAMLLALLLAGAATLAHHAAGQASEEESLVQEKREQRGWQAQQDLALFSLTARQDGVTAFGERNPEALGPRAKPFTSKLPAWKGPFALTLLWPAEPGAPTRNLRAQPAPVPRLAFDLPRVASPPLAWHSVLEHGGVS